MNFAKGAMEGSYGTVYSHPEIGISQATIYVHFKYIRDAIYVCFKSTRLAIYIVYMTMTFFGGRNLQTPKTRY